VDSTVSEISGLEAAVVLQVEAVQRVNKTIASIREEVSGLISSFDDASNAENDLLPVAAE